MVEWTLALIKPDAWERKFAGKILCEIEEHEFRVRASRFFRFEMEEARRFYSNLEGRDCYDPWVEFMCSGPTMALVLEKENAVAEWRKLIGATNPEKAEKWTIRGRWATAINRNLVHASDSLESASREISFFFEERDLFGVYGVNDV